MSDLDFSMDTAPTTEAEQEISVSRGGDGRSSQYDPIARKYEKIADDEAVVVSNLTKNDIQNIRNLLYRRYGKEQVIVRSSQQEDGTYKAVVRDRIGDEYLRDTSSDDTSDNGTEETSEEEVPSEPEEAEDVF